MSQKTLLQRPKGTQDILPEDMPLWHRVENTARRQLGLANYHEIRTPIFETTDLFERGVGDTTDIVNKEMYTFEKGERRLTLRPENTAGVVRAFNENGMSRWPKPVKLFYIGPMFRYERPQAGRQRQFHQLGVECFGLDTPASDAEVIQQAIALFETLGLKDLALEINNIGCLDCRDAFKADLKRLVQPHLPSLCESCQERFNTNPLRMLDCKVSTCQAIYNSQDISAFLNQDSTCEPCQTHYVALKTLLTGLDIPFSENKKLVRGLDYYTRTVFEVTCRHLGAQNAVCGGGRYNHLVEELGGQATPAVGWAVGLERLTSLLEKSNETGLDYYIVSTEALAALKLAHAVREQTGLSVDLDLSGKGFGKQLAHADKLGARYALILGEAELANETVTIKDLKAGTQETKSLQGFMQGLT